MSSACRPALIIAPATTVADWSCAMPTGIHDTPPSSLHGSPKERTDKEKNCHGSYTSLIRPSLPESTLLTGDDRSSACDKWSHCRANHFYANKQDRQKADHGAETSKRTIPAYDACQMSQRTTAAIWWILSVCLRYPMHAYGPHGCRYIQNETNAVHKQPHDNLPHDYRPHEMCVNK